MAGTDDRSAPIPVLINRNGGTAAAAGARLKKDVAAAFRDAGLDVAIRLLDGARIAKAAEKLKGHNMIVVGGGDGTLGAAAEVLAGSDTALGILPLGTHNHFARQIGIPQDLPGAARVLAKGRRKAVDLGAVDGHVFLNNASIGFYPSLVRTREQAQQRHGLPKWLANLPASWTALRRLRHHRLRVKVDGVEQEVRTPLLFIGNNVYALKGGQVGERVALDQGKLSLYAVEGRTRLGALWFGLRVLGGLADLQRDFAVVATCRKLTVGAHAHYIHIALDGEVHRLESPLNFEIRRRALRVVMPSAAEARRRANQAN
jgi:diacylglycerol kinase family enzyme